MTAGHRFDRIAIKTASAFPDSDESVARMAKRSAEKGKG
jgi:hypothetical protein